MIVVIGHLKDHCEIWEQSMILWFKLQPTKILKKKRDLLINDDDSSNNFQSMQKQSWLCYGSGSDDTSDCEYKRLLEEMGIANDIVI